VNSQRILDQIVDIYPDGLVVANATSNGVCISQNFGKTWNKVINRGWVKTITRLSDNTFVYMLSEISGVDERMLTTDLFRSNYRHKNTFWDDVMTADSATNSDIFYVAKKEGGNYTIYRMNRSDYNDDIVVKWSEQYEINITSIRCLNVLRRYDNDILAITDGSGVTTEFDIEKELVTNQYNTGSSYVTTDGQRYIFNLENNRIIKNSLSIRDIDGEIVDYFPKNTPIQKIRRNGNDLYIFYNNPNSGDVIKYNVEKKKASLFFQLRYKARFTRSMRPGIPYPIIPETHEECGDDEEMVGLIKI
jgi:hypothetical protein